MPIVDTINRAERFFINTRRSTELASHITVTVEVCPRGMTPVSKALPTTSQCRFKSRPKSASIRGQIRMAAAVKPSIGNFASLNTLSGLRKSISQFSKCLHPRLNLKRSSTVHQLSSSNSLASLNNCLLVGQTLSHSAPTRTPSISRQSVLDLSSLAAQ